MKTASPETTFGSAAEAELSRLTENLLEELGSADHWTGELSSSALSTAVASIALAQLKGSSSAPGDTERIERGIAWLARHANEDGGWGDTVRSKSNISTTALCWAAFAAADADERYSKIVTRAEQWLARAAGGIERLPEAIAQRYGKDRTFSVPIMVTLAISGRTGPSAWRDIPALPFELSILPRQLFGALKLPVVSYALPALIAIGNAIHKNAPSGNPLARMLRNKAAPRSLLVLEKIQPSNGGFLEAVPLTAFVAMSMAAAGHPEHPVVSKAAGFLRDSTRPDGSLPIDTNLATWVTTLAVKALSNRPEVIPAAVRVRIRDWLLLQQTKTIHPYTGAAPGAWAWTNLPGGVPDADDTSGALLALDALGYRDGTTLEAVGKGIEWLLKLQNSDGGIPTFCRGWGTLPFDRSTPEVTAHALRAWSCWVDAVPRNLQIRIFHATRRALQYLQRTQRGNGSFVPLWFGNEHAQDEDNPVYGTAQVLIALNELDDAGSPPVALMRRSAAEFLIHARLASGGWGGDEESPESIEETALALEALCGCPEGAPLIPPATERLIHLLRAGRRAAPIGLYFARLWYYERLYPQIFALSALARVRSQNR